MVWSWLWLYAFSALIHVATCREFAVKKPPSCRAWLLFISRLFSMYFFVESSVLCARLCCTMCDLELIFVAVDFLKISFLGFASSCVSAFRCACVLNNWMQDATAFSHLRDRWQTRIERTKKRNERKNRTTGKRRRRLSRSRWRNRECTRIVSLLLLLILWFISFHSFLSVTNVCARHFRFGLHSVRLLFSYLIISALLRSNFTAANSSKSNFYFLLCIPFYVYDETHFRSLRRSIRLAAFSHVVDFDSGSVLHSLFFISMSLISI